MRGLFCLTSFPIANWLVVVHLRLVFAPLDFILDDCQVSLYESILQGWISRVTDFVGGVKTEKNTMRVKA